MDIFIENLKANPIAILMIWLLGICIVGVFRYNSKDSR